MDEVTSNEYTVHLQARKQVFVIANSEEEAVDKAIEQAKVDGADWSSLDVEIHKERTK